MNTIILLALCIGSITLCSDKTTYQNIWLSQKKHLSEKDSEEFKSLKSGIQEKVRLIQERLETAVRKQTSRVGQAQFSLAVTPLESNSRLLLIPSLTYNFKNLSQDENRQLQMCGFFATKDVLDALSAQLQEKKHLLDKNQSNKNLLECSFSFNIGQK